MPRERCLLAIAILRGGKQDQGRHFTCTPYADRVEQGDSTVCDGETGDGKKVSVLVTFSSDASYIWERQW